jgi:hypothetical protein
MNKQDREIYAAQARELLEELGAMSDDEFAEHAVEAVWACNYDYFSSSTTDFKRAQLVDCEFRRRSCISPEYGKKLQEKLDEVHEKVKEANEELRVKGIPCVRRN